MSSERLRMMGLRMALAAGVLGLGGCGVLGGVALAPGTYSGELACRLTVTDATGVEASEDYTSAATLVVDEDGGLTVNEEPVEVGALVTRSLPNADLAFEVLNLSRRWRQVVVTYEPRPTLPGIAVTGELVEDYSRDVGGVRVVGHADLVVTDVSGDNAFEIDCSGVLGRE